MPAEAEFEIDQAVLNEGADGSVFLIKVPQEHLTAQMQKSIRDVWQAAWRAAEMRPPSIIIMANNWELASLTDDVLRRAGLMRIKEVPDAPTDA